jgi:hypothetical protein
MSLSLRAKDSDASTRNLVLVWSERMLVPASMNNPGIGVIPAKDQLQRLGVEFEKGLAGTVAVCLLGFTPFDNRVLPSLVTARDCYVKVELNVMRKMLRGSARFRTRVDPE